MICVEPEAAVSSASFAGPVSVASVTVIVALQHDSRCGEGALKECNGQKDYTVASLTKNAQVLESTHHCTVIIRIKT